MTDQTTQVENTTAEPSLEDVYLEAGITEPQAQPQVAAAPTQYAPAPTTPPKVDIPDAYDDGHKAFLQSLVEKQTALENTQQEFVRDKAANEQKLAAARLEEDIQEATAFVTENAGLKDLPYDDKTKTALANFELNERARTDLKFKALWDARNNNAQTKAALQKALSIISKDIAKKFEAKPDSTLVANKRALKAAQQSSATTDASDSDDSPLANLNGMEFERAWANMVRTNN